MLTAPKPEVTFELCPSGTHIARLYRIINLGTHDTEYQGQERSTPLIRLYWELPNEIKEFTTKEGEKKSQPFAISREFTFSMGEKANLRKIVEGMIGTTLGDDEAFAFDIEQLLGMTCLVTVVHEVGQSSGKKFAKLTTTAPMMRGMEAPAQVNESEVLDVNDLSEEAIGKLPDWLQDKMRDSHEYKRKVGTIITPNTAPQETPSEYPELPPDAVPF